MSYSLYTGLFFCAFFILFTVTLIRTWIKNAWVVVLLSVVVVGMTNFEGIVPLYYGIPITAIVSLLFAWSFYRCDALVPLTALFTWSSAKFIAELLSSANPDYASSGWLAFGFFGLLLVYSLAALFRKGEVSDFDAITPAFARHISERQRLQQEIEIARQVQMSLLPKTSPLLGKLNIASRCVPAKEVGGDYYDFIKLTDDKLGVALGDVSGKGTQAAFFMTLTKGFLRALANYSESPAEVLTQVNRLFYDNVERGVFISMLYAVFDVNNNRVLVARAGQNPVIAYKSKSKQIAYLQQNGLALGLDPSDRFKEVIQEMTVQYEPGDLFVFYTDGFPEAMNKKQEEYGDERFSALITGLAQRSADEILEEIFKEMKRFTGSAPQHDDMTIVVVKVV
jgi:serine phosphatase RsbU (regulator of sigma subunit)